MKKQLAIFLVLFLIMGVFGGVQANALGDVCSINGTGYETLDDALAALPIGDTIDLLADITHAGMTFDQGFQINFNLSAYNLTFTGGLTLEGDTSLYISADSEITRLFRVNGSVTANELNGDITAVTCSGKVRAEITGSVITSGYGVLAADGGMIKIDGNINAGSVGALADYEGIVIVDGVISLSDSSGDYVRVDGTAKNQSDGVSSTAMPGYLEYINAIAGYDGAVYVKIRSAASPASRTRSDTNTVLGISLQRNFPETTLTVGNRYDFTIVGPEKGVPTEVYVKGGKIVSRGGLNFSVVPDGSRGVMEITISADGFDQVTVEYDVTGGGSRRTPEPEEESYNPHTGI